MPKIPIDNCPHEFEWDDIAQEEYCKFCGFVPDKPEGGWVDETIEGGDG